MYYVYIIFNTYIKYVYKKNNRSLHNVFYDFCRSFYNVQFFFRTVYSSIFFWVDLVLFTYSHDDILNCYQFDNIKY